MSSCIFSSNWSHSYFFFVPSPRKRSVTHAQLMHDKGRTLQDYKRRMWLQELLDVVHTADTRDVPVRTSVSSSGAGVGLGVGGGIGGGGGGGGGVSVGMGMGLATGGSSLHPKPAGGTKNLPISFPLEDEEGTNLPQETNKSQTYKDAAMRVAGKKKKKKEGRSGKRREGEKRKRRARSLVWARAEEPGSGYHLEWRPYFDLQGALH